LLHVPSGEQWLVVRQLRSPTLGSGVVYRERIVVPEDGLVERNLELRSGDLTLRVQAPQDPRAVVWMIPAADGLTSDLTGDRKLPRDSWPNLPTAWSLPITDGVATAKGVPVGEYLCVLAGDETTEPLAISIVQGANVFSLHAPSVSPLKR
jgi:hypothetical protein